MGKDMIKMKFNKCIEKGNTVEQILLTGSLVTLQLLEVVMQILYFGQQIQVSISISSLYTCLVITTCLGAYYCIINEAFK